MYILIYLENIESSHKETKNEIKIIYTYIQLSGLLIIITLNI